MTHPSVIKRLKTNDVVSNANDVLADGKILGTIVIPKNLNVLASRLPKPNYRTPQVLRKNCSVPNELNEESARKISSSQQNRPIKNVHASLATIDEVPRRVIKIPMSSPSGEDIKIALSNKSSANKHRPIIGSRKGPREHLPEYKNMYLCLT